MKRRLLLALLLAPLSLLGWGSAFPVSGQALFAIYSESELRYWQGRYTASTGRTLDMLERDGLTTAEWQQMGGRPRLSLPLYPAPDVQHPLAFYVVTRTGEIVLPTFSLKFLDDLCTAYAWLQVHGYSLSTLSDYLSVLRHGAPPFRPPLEALGIPADALQNTEVDQLALGHFVTARTFILLHEMGHLLHRHGREAPSLEQEVAADRFAARAMSRTVLPPNGMLVYFFAAAHWAAVPPAPRTHPLAGDRLRALAPIVSPPQLGAALRELGPLLDDLDVRLSFIVAGRSTSMQELSPRRAHTRPRFADAPSDTRPFAGPYEVLLDQDGEQVEGRLWIERRDDRVRSTFTFGLGTGTLDGLLSGDQLHFSWSWAGANGRGVWTRQADGRVVGTWGLDDRTRGWGAWTLHKR